MQLVSPDATPIRYPQSAIRTNRRSHARCAWPQAFGASLTNPETGEALVVNYFDKKTADASTGQVHPPRCYHVLHPPALHGADRGARCSHVCDGWVDGPRAEALPPSSPRRNRYAYVPFVIMLVTASVCGCTLTGPGQFQCVSPDG